MLAKGPACVYNIPLRPPPGLACPVDDTLKPMYIEIAHAAWRQGMDSVAKQAELMGCSPPIAPFLASLDSISGEHAMPASMHKDDTIGRLGTSFSALQFLAELEAGLEKPLPHLARRIAALDLPVLQETQNHTEVQTCTDVRTDIHDGAGWPINPTKGRTVSKKKGKRGANVEISKESQMDISKENHVQRDLLIAYIPRSASCQDLRKTFEEFGAVEQAFLVRDNRGTSKCYGFIRFELVEDAAAVIGQCSRGKVHMTDANGKVWHVKASWATNPTPLQKSSRSSKEKL
eukprot:4086605-Amphidinium_carterae.1